MNYKLLILILLTAIFYQNSSAQETKPSTYNERITDYAKELNLSDSQVQVLTAIKADYKQKMKAIRDSKNPDQESLKKLRLERKAAMEGVLKPDQLAKWKEIVAEQKANRKTNELRAELKKYRKEQIRPVLLEKRKQFEIELSAAEKQIIADQRAKRQAFHKSLKANDSAEDEATKLRGDQLKLESKTALQPILENHQLALEKLEQELEPLQQKWQEDLIAIKSKYKHRKHPAKPTSINKQDDRIYRFLLMPVEM
jgi:hypothetical protein